MSRRERFITRGGGTAVKWVDKENVRRERFSREYVGVFVSQPSSKSSLAEGRNLLKHTCPEVWVFENPDVLLVFVIGGEHAEPVVDWLDDAHRRVDGSSSLASIALPGLVRPNGQEAYLLRFPVPVFFESGVGELLDRCLCLTLAGGEERWVLADGPIALECIRNTPKVKFMAGLVLQAHPGSDGEPQAARVNHRGVYDPVEAQVREVAGSNCSSLVALVVQTATAASESLPGMPLGRLLDPLPDIVRGECAAIRASAADALSGTEAGLALDSMSSRMASTTELLSLVGSGLRHYSPEGDLFLSKRRYSDGLARMMLLAANQVINECLARLGLEDHSVFACYGDGALVLRPLNTLAVLWGYETDRRVAVLEIPWKFGTRAGALPLLAHAVAHLRDSRLAALSGRLVQGRHPIALCVGLSPATGEPPVTDAGLGGISVALNEGLRAARRLVELLADLIACRLIGPAYVFSLGRFATGTMHEIARPDVPSRHQSHPRMGVRITQCLHFLRALRFDFPFESKLVPVQDSAIDVELIALLDEFCPGPYSLDDHAAISEVQAQLADGSRTVVSPSVILNALWDAVAKKSGYLNEMAVLASLSREYPEN